MTIVAPVQHCRNRAMEWLHSAMRLRRHPLGSGLAVRTDVPCAPESGPARDDLYG